MPAGVSALPQTSGTTQRELTYAAWDPLLQVPVIEPLVYTEEGGAAVLNRQVQPNMSGTSGGTGVQAVGIFGYNGTNYYMPEVGSNRLMSVNVVSGSTAGDNVLVDGSDHTVSAQIIQTSANVSSNANTLIVRSVSEDAADLRISAIGGTAGDNVLVDGTDQTVSATLLQVSANVSSNANTFLTRSVNEDAGDLRISAIGGTAGDNILVDGSDQTVSAKLIQVSASVSSSDNTLLTRSTSFDAADLHTSAYQGGGWTLSAFINEGTVSARQGTDPWIVSGTIDSQQVGTWTVSSLIKGGTAFIGNVSATVKNYPLNVSGTVSSFINEGSVSAIQPDATNLRVSADLIAQTTGNLTVHRSLSVSASQNVKSAAGAVYGYYAYNTDADFSYLKLYNVSGAVNLGVDTPILTVGIPPSAAANMEYPHGLIGFTNGIGIAATSGAPDDNTAAPAASALGINLFYK